MAISAKNIVSKGYTGNLVIPANNNRGYFYVVMTSAAGTVEFANGGGLIPVALNNFYEPYVAPTGEISIVTTGTFIVVEG